MIKYLLTKKNLILGILLSILLCIAFYDVVFLNKTFKVTTANSQALPTGVYGQENNKPPFIPVNGTDTPVLEEPIYQFIKENLWRGILPLWNPHQACGYPLIGMIQVAIFYPLNLILYTLPSAINWDILILVRLFLAGLFTFWLMKSFKFRNAPSLTAAIIFMLSGPMVLLQYWTTNVDILLPLLLLCLEKFIRKTNAKTCSLLGLVIGLTILGGHPEHIFLVNIYGIIFFVFRMFSLKKWNLCFRRDSSRAVLDTDKSQLVPTNTKKGLRPVLFLIFAYILGAGISAIALFPFIQNFLTEFWHGHPSTAGLLMEEQRERIITLILPHFFQKAPITFQWVFAGWWGGYIGLLPFALAFLGLFNRHKKGLGVFFGTMAFVIIAKEYGMPIINWLGYLPFFNLVRYAIHTPPLAAFSIAVLAGMGMRAILARKKLFVPAVLFSATVVILTAINLFIVKNASHIQFSINASIFAITILIGFLIILWLNEKRIISKKIIGVLLIAAVFLELFSYIHRERPNRFDSFAKVPYIELLKTTKAPIRSYGNFWAFYPNTATGFGVDDLGFFMGLAPKRFVHFVNEILSPNLFQDNFRSPALRSLPMIGREEYLDMLNVKYIIRPSDQRFIKPFAHFGNYTQNFKKVYSREVEIFQRPNTFPRAFMIHHAIAENDPDTTLTLLKDLRYKLNQTAIINASSHSEILKNLTKPAVNFNQIKFKSYTPNHVEINVTNKQQGLLVLSDAYHPDWKAYIDGKETQIYQTNYLLRSVFLPKGTHNIVFKFHPFWFYTGIVASAISLLIALFMIYFPVNYRK